MGPTAPRARRPRFLTDADRMRIVLESFAGPSPVGDVARRNGVDSRQLSRWRARYRLGQLPGVDPHSAPVPVTELASAMQRIRDLERALGCAALENAMLREAVEFAGLPAAQVRPPARAKRSRT